MTYRVKIRQTVEYEVIVNDDTLTREQAEESAGEQLAWAGELTLKEMETGYWLRYVTSVEES